MIEELVKNLWLLLTLGIPGFFTYGLWRMLLIFEPVAFKNDIFAKVDESVLLTTSFIVAIALVQQSASIVIESALSIVSKVFKKQLPYFYELFCGRFALASSGKLDENTTRIIGNFFLSMNISMGNILIYIFYKLYASEPSGWVFTFLYISFGITGISAFYRMLNALWAIKKKQNAH